MITDVVEYEVTRALEWLQGERIESRRLASVLILREMADNAPTLFHHHVGVRLCACVRVCLRVLVASASRCWRIARVCARAQLAPNSGGLPPPPPAFPKGSRFLCWSGVLVLVAVAVADCLASCVCPAGFF
jgi:hypothetical protein